MNRTVGLLIAFVAALLFAVWLLAMAPLKLVQPLLASAMPGVQLHDVEGSLWRGKAARTDVAVDYMVLDLGELDWVFEPGSLLHGKPAWIMQLRSAKHKVSTRVRVFASNQLHLSQLTGYVPMAMLEPWMPVLIGGNLDLSIDELRIQLPEADKEPPRLLGFAGLINLQQAVWLGGDRDMPLGSYQAEMGLSGDQMQVELQDMGASLGLQGRIEMAMTGDYSLRLLLIPRPGLAYEISQSIGWLGRRNTDGNVLIDRRGRFHLN